MSDCLFCRIIKGEVPAQRVYEDDNVLAFHDISPQAPVHILVVPKAHIASAADFTAENSIHAANCFAAIAKIAKSEGLIHGFRVITNSGADGNQSVFHIHFHLLGGKEMGEKLVIGT